MNINANEIVESAYDTKFQNRRILCQMKIRVAYFEEFTLNWTILRVNAWP